MRTALRLALLALLFPVASHAAFLSYGDPAYEALQKASARAGNRGWVADMLQKSQPISEMLAREEAQVLLLNKHLDPYYIKSLKDAFPQDSEPVEQKFVVLDSRVKALDEKVDLVTAKLDRFEAGMRDGLLSGRSRPSLLGSLGGDMFTARNIYGPGPTPAGLAKRSLAGSGVWTEWSLADDGFGLTWVMMFYPGYVEFNSAHLGLAFDNAFLPGIEMVIADENNYPALSLLIFNGGGDGYSDDFYKMGELTGRKDLIKSAAGYGARGGQDIYIRRKSSGDWWPFSDTQFVATQTFNYWFGHKLNDVCANFKLRGMPMFWPFERADPSITTLWSFNDQADINGGQDPFATVSDNSSAQSFAVNMLVAGGGTFYLEAATAEWEKSDVPKSYRDIAVASILSKSIGRMALVVDFQHTGPDFFPGTSDEASGNAASSMESLNTVYTDASGNQTTVSKQVWRTVASEPTEPTTNSQHLSFGSTFDLTSASLGISLGTNMQIEPSGYVLTSRHMVGWPWSGLGSGNCGHGLDINKDEETNLMKAYNQADPNVSNVAVHPDGSVVTLDNGWVGLDNYNRESIHLTEHGVGDNHLRGDSMKYVNFLDLRGDINLQSLFDMERSCLIKFASRLRNTTESVAVPAYTDQALLMQIASSVTFNVALPKNMSFVTAVGYEDWLSRATFIPIEFHTSWATVSFSRSFPNFMTGLDIGPGFSVMRNYDPNSDQHGFSMWATGIGASTSF